MVKAVFRLFLVAILQTAVVVVGDHGSDFLDGEQVCEGKGYNSTECLGRSWCCDWDDGQCWSRIGRQYCEKKNSSSDNFETCYAYLNDNDVLWDAVDPLPRDCDVPKYLIGSVPRDDFSDSCCSSGGAASSRNYDLMTDTPASFSPSFFGFYIGIGDFGIGIGDIGNFTAASAIDKIQKLDDECALGRLIYDACEAMIGALQLLVSFLMWASPNKLNTQDNK